MHTQSVTSIKLNPVVKQSVTRLSDIPVSFICSLMSHHLSVCLYICINYCRNQAACKTLQNHTEGLFNQKDHETFISISLSQLTHPPNIKEKNHPSSKSLHLSPAPHITLVWKHLAELKTAELKHRTRQPIDSTADTKTCTNNYRWCRTVLVHHHTRNKTTRGRRKIFL